MRALSALAFGVAVVVAGPAVAADYPVKPVTMIVNTVGGTTEPVLRLIEQKISEKKPVRFIYEAKVGAAGTISAAFVARAPADGYTFLVANGAAPVWQAVYKNLTFDMVKDFEMVSVFGKAQLTMVAIKDFPANDLNGVVAAAKAAPGKYSYGSVGIGSLNQIVTEELKLKTGINIVHVPYTGSADVIRSMLTGELPLAVVPPNAALQQINAGALKAIATLSPVRSPALPNTPLASDSISGLTGHEFWVGLLAPAGTPKDVVQQMHDLFDEALKDAAVAQAITNVGFQPVRETVDQSRTRLQTDVRDFSAIAKAANISVD